MKRALLIILVGCVVEYGYSQEFLARAKAALIARDTTAAIPLFESL
jgi:hypothetical protein